MKKIILLSAVLFLSIFVSTSLLAKETKLVIIKSLGDSTTVAYPQIKDIEKRDIEGRSYTFATINGIRGMIANEGNLLSEMSRVANVRFDKFLKYNDLANSTYDVRVGEVYYLAPKNKTANKSHHVLLEGENFRKVAQKYGIQMRYIYKYNRLKVTQIPQVGLLIWLQKKRPKNVAPEIRQESEDKVNTEISAITNTNTQTNQGNIDEEPLSTHGVIDNTLDTGTGNEEVDEELQNEFAKLKNEGLISGEEGETNTIINTQDIAEATAENTLTNNTTENVSDENNPPTDDLVRYATKQDGETLYAIAVQHNVTTDQLRKWNDIEGMEIPKKGTLIVVGVAGQEDANEEESVAGIPIINPETGQLETVQDTSTQTNNNVDDFGLPIPNTDSQNSNLSDLLAQNSGNSDIHIIQKGETLWGISQKYNLNVDDLRKWNALTNKNEINHGEQLVLKSELALPFDESMIDDTASSQDNDGTQTQDSGYSVEDHISDGGTGSSDVDTTTSNQTKVTKHKVLAGETLISIAKEHNITVEKLRYDNGGLPEDYQPVVGESLEMLLGTTTTDVNTESVVETDQAETVQDEVVDNTTNATVSTEKTTTYIVTKGETLYSVAQKHGITVDKLKELNNRRSDIVYANEELIIKKE